MMNEIFQGSLFTHDFLTQSISDNPDWAQLTDSAIDGLASELQDIFAKFPVSQTPNETRTEDDLIWPILRFLGWSQSMRQQNLTVKGREDVPDGLLFADAAAKAQADQHLEEYKRYQFGLAVVESKRWKRPLDRRSSKRGEELAPSTQMLRYLRRVDDLTTGKLRWGVLTNGGRWRLYYSGARSVSEQFFEIDLAAVLRIEGQGDGLFALDAEEQRHALRAFALIFRREAFLPSATDQRTFHQRAMDEGKFYEERVATDLSNLVFAQVYPLLARSIATAAPEAGLQDVRQAALILLYRLLFILYAEDRDLLPVNDRRYDDYGLRDKVRMEIGRRKDDGDIFSSTAARYWSTLDDLCRAIDKGDTSIGLPPYNGGLFDADRTPLLGKIRLPDSVMAEVIDKLSFERRDGTRKYINYRDLTVQQLGSIYERLLEHEVVKDGETVEIRPNIFARKGSGSYYTPDDLVSLIIHETLEPLIGKRVRAFEDKARELADGTQEDGLKLTALKRLDPAERLLDLRICDPAMGSGHFLVSLVDYLSDQVIIAMAETEKMVEWASEDHPYISPLADRIEAIRNTILGNAEARKWTVDPEQLDDRHIIRRMVLKRCVYGVDKNVMAVELAKVALWLHSFTVGAPLSFLDHHLRCGDSLFGSWVKTGIAKATAYGSPLLLHEPVKAAYGSAASMQMIEGLPDAEIAEAHRSQEIFDGVQVMTAPLNAFLSLLHAIEWLNLKGKDNAKAIKGFFDGAFGDPFEIALGKREPKVRDEHGRRFVEILASARELVIEENFLNWQVAFPGVWSDWQEDGLKGGFDAIIGNPPWDRMKLQQVEWFAARKRDIALAQRASDRAKMIASLEKAGDPLARDYAKAATRAETGTRMARSGGDYPLLSGGDINLYSLFVERAMRLARPDGLIGLLTPSGIASDLTAAKFFKGVATEGRLKALYDFENRRPRYELKPFFEDVDSRFKFCAFVASPSPLGGQAQCAFFLQATAELNDPEVRFTLSADDFAKVNPNTGTAPIFRSRRDADLTKAIYAAAPILVDRSSGAEVKAWPVKYATMFHMTNDSGLFRTRKELEEEEGAYPIGGNLYGSASGSWRPLYVGRMIHQFDHRAASVEVNEANVHNAALSGDVSAKQKADPTFAPTPQFWVQEKEITLPAGMEWSIAFRDIARATDARTIIAAAIPRAGVGNKAPLLIGHDRDTMARHGPTMLANLNATIFDFAARSKVHSTSVNWYIVEQLPVIPLAQFEARKFGKKTAAQVVQEIVLELTYNAHDMAPLAKDMGYVDESGTVLPPFTWDEERRLKLRAKLDAVFFLLYGIENRDDVRYIYSTFPIIERQELDAYGGRYRSRDLCLSYMNALKAGDPDAEIDL
ncbi:Eco57I restriction-modification methylase domain-containing protein [Neotabrizicola sp. VNH66]|uniref:Eco57I restriction-modification methylase domain-containing protein n=1 Tax=Neotabrizicola sp. VNH66 TaxID=3400918 RepID=UPI003C063F80